MTSKRKTTKRDPTKLNSRRRLPRLRPDPAPVAAPQPVPRADPAVFVNFEKAVKEVRAAAARDLIDRVAGEVKL